MCDSVLHADADDATGRGLLGLDKSASIRVLAPRGKGERAARATRERVEQIRAETDARERSTQPRVTVLDEHGERVARVQKTLTCAGRKPPRQRLIAAAANRLRRGERLTCTIRRYSPSRPNEGRNWRGGAMAKKILMLAGTTARTTRSWCVQALQGRRAYGGCRLPRQQKGDKVRTPSTLEGDQPTPKARTRRHAQRDLRRVRPGRL